MHAKRKKSFLFIPVCAMLLAAQLAGCANGTSLSSPPKDSKSVAAQEEQNGAITYELDLTGTATEPGVISFLDFYINVYLDEASNSCGDCADQPVHLYVGATAEEAAQAIADAVTRANDLWHVDTRDGSHLVLKENMAGTVKKKDINDIEVPKGLTMTDNFGHMADGSVTSEAAGEKTIYDLKGNPLKVPTDVSRIAAVYGPSYEAMVVLGQEDRIVVCADVQKDNFPWAQKLFSRMEDLPCLVNVHSSVNAEELMLYEPDLVLSFSRPNEQKQMEAMGISYIPGTTTTALDEIPKLLHVYAHAIGHGANARADAYEAWFNEKLSMITKKTEKLPESERPAVYYSGIDLLTTYGSFSDIPEVIDAAGGSCVTKDVKAGNHTQISFEQLAEWNPDYIFIDHGSIGDHESVEELKSELSGNGRYAEITAVRNNQVILSPSGVFYWDMGLQKILLVMYMAKTIHPELFSDLDMTAELMDFYQKFYGCTLTRKEAERILSREDP